MRLMLLGQLQLLDDAGEHITVAGPRQRILLAALAVRANQPVSLDALAEAVWDGVPPPGSIATLRTHLARLRRCLGPGIARRIVTRAPGYAIELSDDELDLLAFGNHCRRAAAALRAADNAQASASGMLALSLWRGEPMLDVPSQLLHDLFVPQLERQRVQVAEDWIEAELRLGRHEQVLAQLRDLTARYPLRERFHAQLMLALAHSGRRTEALQAYQDARKTLVAELGVEPGRELRTLHERILAGDGAPPDTPPSGDQALARTPAAEVPRQLPAATRHFTGRGAELRWLTDLASRCDPHAPAGDTVVISAIDGMAGIGKTALAVQAAHLVCGRFPNGQLFVDLHGYTKGHPPREPGDALGMLLRAVQVPAQHIPEDTEERAALYRQRLAGTKTLVLLDNAADEAQVRPLLPATPGCLVLVTSRRRLRGLDDAHSVSLELLTPRDAVALLHAVAGPGRVRATDPLLDEIADRCGRLPLALRIAGSLLRHRPAWNPEHLAALLRDEHRRVATLSDGERNLATVFDLSYTGLSGRHQLLLRRLGLVPGGDADAYAAGALLDSDPDTATGLLEDLTDHNLLIAHAPGRYRLHDLIRAHSRILAAIDPAPERDAAVDRLLHYYAHTAHIASIPIIRHRQPAPGGPAPAFAPALPDPGIARAWLRTERDNLEQAHTHAQVSKLHQHTPALAAGLAEILRTDGPYARALALHQAAADSAQQHGNPTAHASALTDLGIMRRLSGDLTGAAGALSRALEICRATGDRHGEAGALAELARARGYAGDLTGAVEACSEALELYRETGDCLGEADVLADLGIMRRVSGDPGGAAGFFSRALEICRTTGDHHGEADVLTELGRARAMIGDLTGAGDALCVALEFYRATGHHHGEAYVLTNLGTVRRLAGDLTGAEGALGQALEIYRTIGYSHGEAEALANLGIARRLAGDLAGAHDAQAAALEIYRKIGSRHDEAWALSHYAATIAASGDLPRATTLYQQALTMNRELDKPDGQAIALEGLGECQLTTGETETGAACLREALEIFQRLGLSPDAERVQTRLAAISLKPIALTRPWSGDVQLTVAALRDRDGRQAGRGRSRFDRAGGGVELRAVAGAEEKPGGLVVSDGAAGVRAHGVEGQELAGLRLDHDGGITAAGVGERGGPADRDILRGPDRRASRMAASGRAGTAAARRRCLCGGRRLGRGRQRAGRVALRAAGQPAQAGRRASQGQARGGYDARHGPLQHHFPAAGLRLDHPAAASPGARLRQCPGREHRVGGQYRPRPRQQQGCPRESEHDVRSGVVRRRVEADRQEQHQRQRHAARRGHSLPQAEQRAEANGEFAERDQQAERSREVGQRRDQQVDGTAMDRASQLRLDRRRIACLEEPGIGELLQSGEAEREPEEGPQRK